MFGNLTGTYGGIIGWYNPGQRQIWTEWGKNRTGVKIKKYIYRSVIKNFTS